MPSQIDPTDPLALVLEELGLTEHERHLYALSLRLGPVSTAVLATHLRMPRSNVYKVIAGLQSHGLAQFSGKERYSKTFLVESPSVIVDLLRKKQQRLATQGQQLIEEIPALISLFKQGDRPSKVKILQGRTQFLETFARVVEEAENEVCFFGSFQHFLSFISTEAGLAHIQKRVKKEIFSRALLLPDEEAIKVALRDKEERRETRIHVGKNLFVTSFYLFANKLVLWQPKAPLAILIEDEYIVMMVQDMFDVLWSVAKRPSAQS